MDLGFQLERIRALAVLGGCNHDDRRGAQRTANVETNRNLIGLTAHSAPEGQKKDADQASYSGLRHVTQVLKRHPRYCSAESWSIAASPPRDRSTTPRKVDLPTACRQLSYGAVILSLDPQPIPGNGAR